MNKNIQHLLQRPAIWRLGDAPRVTNTGITTGFSHLDAELPDHGWPPGALTELLCDRHGIGEFSILMPTLRLLSNQNKNIVIIAPPYLPFARALDANEVRRDRLLIVEASKDHLAWSAEQAIKSSTSALVIVWDTKRFDYTQLRRLHLAAENGNTVCILYRSLSTQNNPSTAPLRITLTADKDALCAKIIKRRGSLASSSIRLSLYPSYWQLPQQNEMASDQAANGLVTPIKSTVQ